MRIRNARQPDIRLRKFARGLRFSVVRIPQIALACFLSLYVFLAVPATAQNTGSGGSLDGPTEPSFLLPEIDERKTQRDSLIPVSPLGRLRDSTTQAKTDLYEASGLKLGFAFAHVFQGITDSLPGTDKSGTATVTDFVGTWDLIDRGKPTQGQLIAHVQGRWDYGTTAPEDLGFVSLASAIGTADTFAKYSPRFVLRNLYWRQGSPEAGWSYRLGKITPDGILSSSAHLDSQLTFLPSGGVSSLAIAFPDSGWGAVGAWYPTDRTALVGLVSDANADRFDTGDIGAGDFFVGGEFNVKVAPKTENAGFS